MSKRGLVDVLKREWSGRGSDPLNAEAAAIFNSSQKTHYDQTIAVGKPAIPTEETNNALAKVAGIQRQIDENRRS